MEPNPELLAKQNTRAIPPAPQCCSNAPSLPPKVALHATIPLVSDTQGWPPWSELGELWLKLEGGLDWGGGQPSRANFFLRQEPSKLHATTCVQCL